MRKYSDEKRYTCDVYTKSFAANRTLAKHLRTHGGEIRTFVTFAWSALQIIAIWRCTKRDTAVINRFVVMRVRNPLQTVGKERQIRTYNGEKPYSWGVCTRSFAQNAILTTHVRTHSGNKPYSCEVCTRSFAQSNGLTKHTKTHNRENPFCYDVGMKCFADSSNSKRHIRMHNGEKPYSCGVCTRSFTRNSGLTKHTRTHDGD